MPRKTTRRTASRRTASGATQETGLIAKRDSVRRSPGTKCALDNRSHRTPKFCCEWSTQHAITCSRMHVLSSQATAMLCSARQQQRTLDSILLDAMSYHVAASPKRANGLGNRTAN